MTYRQLKQQLVRCNDHRAYDKLNKYLNQLKLSQTRAFSFLVDEQDDRTTWAASHTTPVADGLTATD